MQKYIVRRFIQGFITLWVLAVIVFALGRATGSPVHLLLRPDATAEEEANLIRVLGLDRPYHVQFYYFITNAVKGDFGISIRHSIPALELYLQRLPNSFRLAAVSMGITLILALPLGVTAAVKRGTFIDRMAMVLAVIGMAAPSFWLGLVLINLVSVRLGLLPTSGMGGLQHYVLPGLTMGTFMLAGFVRLLRSSMLDVLDSEYVRLARIKGVSETMVIWKHSLRNALIPVLSFASVYLAALVSGAIVVETVFAWPGVGRLIYEAVMTRDYPVMQAAVLFTASFVLVTNLVVDILYAYVDPRIRYV